jgi:hypothetical protein
VALPRLVEDMFLKSYIEVDLDFAVVRAAMQLRPPRWLDGVTEAAEEDGARLLVEVGLEFGGHEFARRAVLEVGDTVVGERLASLQLRIRVEDQTWLFPTLDGTLDAAWLGPGRTHLALDALYDPPLGVVGNVVDRALLHRVAEVVAHRFLENAAAHLLAQAEPAGKERPST